MLLLFKLSLAANNNNKGVVDPSSNNNLFAQSDSANVGPTTASTTVFHTDADVVAAARAAPRMINRLLFQSASLDDGQEIKDFLAKPLMLHSGVLSATDNVSTFPRMDLPRQALAQNPFKAKTEGFLGFRATMVVRLTINANRFQQGRYMLCYVPSCGASTDAGVGLLRYLSHTNTLISRTQLPRIELDLACDTEGTLRIPYASVMNYYPLRAATTGETIGDWGVIQLFPYSTLVAPTGSATAPFTIQIHFEDIELIAATVPQSGRMMGKKSHSEKEAQSQDIGPLQSALIKVSSASAMFKPVPLISSYAGGLSWLADIAAGAAGVFGWSKPRNLAAQTKVVRETAPGIFNVDVSDVGQSLSLSSKNAVDVMPGFSGTDVDEMDFSFIATIPSWVNTFTWNTTQIAGTQLATFPICPADQALTRTLLGGVVVTDYSPLAFVASYFKYWRGSMVLTFKIVKTEYHSGRLMFVYYPTESSMTTAPTSMALSVYTHREIVDIREKNEITFTIPYVSTSSYKQATVATGFVAVYVHNPLAAPASVSSTVSILTEYAGGHDVEFAVPRLNTNAPVLGATPQSGEMRSKTTPDVCRIADTHIGNSQAIDDKSVNAAACIGESITSFRTLLKSNFVLAPQVDTTPLKFLLIRPFAASAYYNATVNPYPTTVGDLYSTLSGIYGMSRGGVRFKIFTDAAQSSKYPSMAYLEAFDPGEPFVSTSVWSLSSTALGGALNVMNRFNGCPLTVMHANSNFVSEFTVPQYNRYHSRATFDNMVNSNIPAAVVENNLMDRNLVTFFIPGVATITQPQVFRGASDDANFGVFISIPPMQKGLGFQSTL